MHETNHATIEQFELDRLDQPAVALMLGAQRNDTEFPVHTHRKGQLVVAYHGGIVCTVEDGVWMVPSGFGVWIPGGVAHSNKSSQKIRRRTRDVVKELVEDVRLKDEVDQPLV